MVRHIYKLILLLLLLKPQMVSANDWIVTNSKDICAISTLEKLNGNLKYPSYFQLTFLKRSRQVFGFVYNEDWDLKTRNTKVYFAFENRNKKSIPVFLSSNLAMFQGADFVNRLRSGFQLSNNVSLLNSKSKKIANFSLIGFSNSLNQLSKCAGADLSTSTPNKLVEKKQITRPQNINAGSALFSIIKIVAAGACISNPACAAGFARGLSGSKASSDLNDEIDYQDLIDSNNRALNKYLSKPSRNKKQCNSDLDCPGIRSKCVERLNESMCVRLVDEDHRKIRDRKAEPIEDQCRRDRDCPRDFKCHQSLKICISEKY